MDFSILWFAPIWQHLAHIILLLLLIISAKPAWQQARQSPKALGVLILLFAVLWHLRAGLGSGQLAGMNYHLLGVALGSLMIGVPLMLWTGVGLMAVHFIGWQPHQTWAILSLNALCLLLPTLMVSYSAQQLCRRFLPANLFIYIFINGFFTAALGMILTGLLIISLLSFSPTFSSTTLWSGAFPVFFLLSWGEAFLTGLFTAIFVALQPQLLTTFDDKHYLQRTNQIWQPEP